MSWNNILFSLSIFCVNLFILNVNTIQTKPNTYEASEDISIDQSTQLYLAYLIEESDILVKKLCECIPENKCIMRDTIQLTG